MDGSTVPLIFNELALYPVLSNKDNHQNALSHCSAQETFNIPIAYA